MSRSDSAILCRAGSFRHERSRHRAGLNALVQEDRVEHLAAAGRAEGDIREAEHRVHAGHLGLDPPDRLDGLDPVPPLSSIPVDSGEQCIKEESAGSSRIADGKVVDGLAARSFQSAVRAWPSVSMQVQITLPRSRARASGSDRAGYGAPSSRFTELRTASAYPLEGSFGDRSLVVSMTRGSTTGWQSAAPLLSCPVLRRRCVVDAHVEQMGALTNLVACHRDRGLESPASIASRKRLDPLAFVRSPMTRNDAPARTVSQRTAKLQTAHKPASEVRARDPRRRPRPCEVLGVVPQQPPTTETPVRG